MPTQSEKNQALANARRAKAATGRAADQQQTAVATATAVLAGAEATLAQKIADEAPADEIKQATIAKLDAQADLAAQQSLFVAAQLNYSTAVSAEADAESLVVE